MPYSRLFPLRRVDLLVRLGQLRSSRISHKRENKLNLSKSTMYAPFLLIRYVVCITLVQSKPLKVDRPEKKYHSRNLERKIITNAELRNPETQPKRRADAPRRSNIRDSNSYVSFKVANLVPLSAKSSTRKTHDASLRH